MSLPKESVPTLRFRPGLWPEQSAEHVTIVFEFMAGPPEWPKRFGNSICFSAASDDAEAIAVLERAADEIHLAYERASDPSIHDEYLYSQIQNRLDRLAGLQDTSKP